MKNRERDALGRAPGKNLALVLLVAASSAARSEESASTADQVSSVAEIVVTAERMSERLQDVPVPVTVLTSDALAQQGDVKLEDYFRSVPGVALQGNGQGWNQVVIRGISTGTDDTPTVGVYIDDMPLGSATAQARGDQLAPDLDPADLQQIEVLKGPQGTLYGASAMGGLLKYVTVQPQTDRVFGRLSLDGSKSGNAGYGVRGAVNVPLINDRLALYVSGFKRQDPGYIDDPVTGKSNVNEVLAWGGRAALLWKAAEDTTVKLSFLSQQRHALGSQRVDYNSSATTPTYGDLEQVRLPGTETDRESLNTYNLAINSKFAGIDFVSSTSYSLSEYFNHQDLTSLFSALDAPLYGLDALGVPLDQHLRTRRFTQEFRLNGSALDNRLDWLGGLFFTHENSYFLQQDGTADPVTGVPLDVPALYIATTPKALYQEYAAFGDLTYHFTSAFDVQAGVRYSSNRQNVEVTGAGLANCCYDLVQGSDDHATTFLVSGRYKLNADSMVYTRIASGYRVGGPNVGVAAGDPTEFGSDRTVNYEVGLKSSLFDRTLYLDMSAFYITWEQIQLTTRDALDNEYVVNGGSAVSRGFELSGTLTPVRGLTFTENLAFTDAHLTADAPPNFLNAPAGSRLPYSARFTSQLGADYTVALATNWSGDLGLRYSYVGKRIADFVRSPTVPRFQLPAYNTVDVHAGLTHGNYTGTFYVKNVNDERGMLGDSPLTLSGLGDYAVTIIQPRTYGLTLTVTF